MNYIKEIIRGLFIGIANIIPGVSGGTMAVSMGIYDKIIGAVNNLKKDFKNSVKTLIPYGVGAVIGIVCLSFVLEFLLANYEFPTITLFIGLILGGLPPILKRVENEKFKITHFISFTILLLTIIIPAIYAGSLGIEPIGGVNLFSIMILIVLGIVAAGAMVIPGVSGSMVLMMVGYYEYLNNAINNFVTSLVKFDMAGMISNIGILLPFGIGVFAGIFIMAKIIGFLLKRYPNATMWGIIGLIVASPFAILVGVSTASITGISIIVSLITFVVGYIVADKLSKM